MSITPLPTPPSKTDPVNFDQRADAFLGALPGFVTETNALAVIVEGYETDALAAQTAAETAQGLAEAAQSGAETARDTALAGANFKGNWSDLTGALNMPSSVAHDGKFWALAANLADVTTAEPGVAASWVEIVTGAGALPIGLPDWPATLTRTDGELTQVVYAQGVKRYRQQLTRTNGVLSSVLYSYSGDSGATWTGIGTETLNYTDGEMTSTTWTAA